MKLKLFFSALLFVSAAHAQYPRTVVIDSTLNLQKYFGDTVTMYAPGQIVKIGKRLMLASAFEQELGAYKLLYSHCDSLRMIKDSSANSFVTTIGHLESLNKNLNERLKVSSEINEHLSKIANLERKKGRRQKFIWGFAGAGGALLIEEGLRILFRSLKN